MIEFQHKIKVTLKRLTWYELKSTLVETIDKIIADLENKSIYKKNGATSIRNQQLIKSQ